MRDSGSARPLVRRGRRPCRARITTQPVGTGVDDARLGEHVELLGSAARRASSPAAIAVASISASSAFCSLGGRAGSSRRCSSSCDLARLTASCHLADHGQHRALGAGREPTRRRPRRRCAKRRRDQLRVDQLAAAASPSTSAAPRTIWLRITPRVAPRPHQRRAGDGVDDLVAGPASASPSRARGRSSSSSTCAHRQRHVVAGVAVGDREHVQVVDLLLARLRWRSATPTTWRKRCDGRIRHRPNLAIGRAPDGHSTRRAW